VLRSPRTAARRGSQSNKFQKSSQECPEERSRGKSTTPDLAAKGDPYFSGLVTQKLKNDSHLASFAPFGNLAPEGHLHPLAPYAIIVPEA
jgi:hypothetical protein